MSWREEESKGESGTYIQYLIQGNDCKKPQAPWIPIGLHHRLVDHATSTCRIYRIRDMIPEMESGLSLAVESSCALIFPEVLLKLPKNEPFCSKNCLAADCPRISNPRSFQYVGAEGDFQNTYDTYIAAAESG